MLGFLFFPVVINLLGTFAIHRFLHTTAIQPFKHVQTHTALQVQTHTAVQTQQMNQLESCVGYTIQ